MGVENPQVVELFAFIMATTIGVFWAMCFLAGCAGKAGKAFKIPERFDIGYYDPPDPIVFVKEVPAPAAPKPKKKKQPKKVVSEKTDELLTDCVGALISLGTKRGEARRVAAQFLVANPDVKDVQTFIREVFARK